MSLVRRLPAVPRTVDQPTRAWIQAAHEIIERLQQGSGAVAQVIVPSNTSGASSTINKNSLGLGNVDNTSDADKPVSTAVQTALDGLFDRVRGVSVDLWDVSAESLEDVGAEASDWFLITGAGTFRGKFLAVGDAALFYTDSAGDLDVIVVPDVSRKEDKINKVENLDAPDHNTYPTTQAVADALEQSSTLKEYTADPPDQPDGKVWILRQVINPAGTIEGFVAGLPVLTLTDQIQFDLSIQTTEGIRRLELK